MRSVDRDFESHGGGHAFECWARTDDVVDFGAHITFEYPAAASAVSAAAVVAPPSSSCWGGCLSGLRSFCGRAARADSGKQLYLFVNEENFGSLIGDAFSREEASVLFARWLGNVPGHRRWGHSAERPSVSVAVDGVYLPAHDE